MKEKQTFPDNQKQREFIPLYRPYEKCRKEFIQGKMKGNCKTNTHENTKHIGKGEYMSKFRIL